MYRLVLVFIILNLFNNIAVSQPLSRDMNIGKTKGPNILFITTDYQSGDDIPSITPVLQMPNLAKLIREGATFQNHFSVAPICIPSRYSIISGVYPHTHGQWDNEGEWLPNGIPTLMELLSSAGYQTTGIGKMHFSPWDRMAGFAKRIIAERKGNGSSDTLRKDDYAKYLATAGLTRWDYLKRQATGEIFGVYDWPFKDSLHIDYFVGNETVKFINSNKGTDKPWFTWVSFNGPHNPWDPPKRFADYYMEKDLPIFESAGNFFEENSYKITEARYNYTRKVVDQIDGNPDKRKYLLKRILAGHYGGLTFIDEQIGKIISALEKNGQLDNTIIIFSSDHGAHLGDHDMIHKGTALRRSANIPFIVWWPGKIKKGVRTGFTSHIDLMPTLLDIAGLSKPSSNEGESMIDVITGKSEGSDHTIIEIRDSYSWICNKYNFGIHFSSREESLFDLTNDPGELKNVVHRPEYKKIVDSLRSLLFAFHPAIKDDWNNTKIPQKPLNYFNWTANSKQDYRTDLRSKSFLIESKIKIVKGEDSKLFSFQQGAPHSFSVSLIDNKIVVDIRTWYKNVRLKSNEIEAGMKIFEFKMNSGGILYIINRRRVLLSMQTKWPLPYQHGQESYMAGSWIFGNVANAKQKHSENSQNQNKSHLMALKFKIL